MTLQLTFIYHFSLYSSVYFWFSIPWLLYSAVLLSLFMDFLYCSWWNWRRKSCFLCPKWRFLPENFASSEKVVPLWQQFPPRLLAMRTTVGLRFYIRNGLERWQHIRTDRSARHVSWQNWRSVDWLSMMTTKPLNISAASIISALLAFCSPLKSILSPISIYLVRVLSTLYDISLFHIPILFNFTEWCV